MQELAHILAGAVSPRCQWRKHAFRACKSHPRASPSMGSGPRLPGSVPALKAASDAASSSKKGAHRICFCRRVYTSDAGSMVCMVVRCASATLGACGHHTRESAWQQAQHGSTLGGVLSS